MGDASARKRVMIRNSLSNSTIITRDHRVYDRGMQVRRWSHTNRSIRRLDGLEVQTGLISKIRGDRPQSGIATQLSE